MLSQDTPGPWPLALRKSTNFRRAGRRGDDLRGSGRGEDGDDTDQGMEIAVDVSEAWPQVVMMSENRQLWTHLHLA